MTSLRPRASHSFHQESAMTCIESIRNGMIRYARNAHRNDCTDKHVDRRRRDLNRTSVSSTGCGLELAHIGYAHVGYATRPCGHSRRSPYLRTHLQSKELPECVREEVRNLRATQYTRLMETGGSRRLLGGWRCTEPSIACARNRSMFAFIATMMLKEVKHRS